MYLSNPTAWAEYDTRSIFKRNLTGLIWEFYCFKTSCHTTVLTLVWEQVFILVFEVKTTEILKHILSFSDKKHG